MHVCALMIGRGGSTLRDKNVLPVLGVPLLLWGCAAARSSKYITSFYISSDDQKILHTAGLAGYKPIVRPNSLASDTARSSDAVRHALDIIEQETGVVDLIVVQHANVGTITGDMIDECIELILSNADLSSVVPAHEHPEYHPMRAKRVREDGTLESFFTGSISPNRQELPKAVFFDHSFWVLRGRSAVFDPSGQEPWPCMGSKILPYLTEGCLDVHDLADLARTEEWLKKNNIPAPNFSVSVK